MDNNQNTTKKCKGCGSDIPKHAKVCPHCMKKQGIRPWMIVLVVILVFFIIGIFGSSSTETTTEGQTVTDNTNTSQQPAEQPTVTREPIELSDGSLITITKEQAGKYIVQQHEVDNGFGEIGSGMLYVNGDVRNFGSGGSITLEEGDQVQLDNCQPGETWTLTPANK